MEAVNERAELEIRVVLWPQSTKTSVGPPDSDRWWSGGLLENSPLKNSILTIFFNWHSTHNGLYKKRSILLAEFDLKQKY